MKVYLDACCLSRLTDDQSQPRIREEADAVERILTAIRHGAVELVSSQALENEVQRTPSRERRLRAQILLRLASNIVEVDDSLTQRANELTKLGFGAFDALHLAAAESAEADALLTTDDRFVKLAGRESSRLKIQVRNPIFW